MISRNLNSTIWILGKDNKYLPTLKFTPESTMSMIFYYIFYTFLWVIMVTRYADTKHMKEITFGFIFGIFTLMSLDYINNFSYQLVVDKNTGAYTLINSSSVYIAENNKYYKFNTTESILMNQEVANKLIKNNQLKAMSLYEYRNKQYTKLGSGKLGSPTANTEIQNIKLLAASYMIISLITLGMISSDISEQLSKSIMPYITAATLFSVSILSYWILTPDVSNIIRIAIFKLKSLIMAIAFSLTACLIFLNETK